MVLPLPRFALRHLWSNQEGSRSCKFPTHIVALVCIACSYPSFPLRDHARLTASRLNISAVSQLNLEIPIYSLDNEGGKIIVG